MYVCGCKWTNKIPNTQLDRHISSALVVYQPNTPLSRHISSALMVCQSIGFTHRRIRRASPLVSGRPISPTHSTRTVSPSIMHVHVRGMETTHIPRFDGMSANRIHSPSNPSCLAPCLWSPCLAHSHTLYSLSVHYAYTLVSDTYGYGSCHSV